MQFIFDHMGAFFAMTGVLLIFGLVQMRGTQSASEAVLNNMVYSDIVGFSEYLMADLSNMRTQAQTDDAITAGNFVGGSAYDCSVTKNGDVTTVFTFPTLGDPQASYSVSNPNDEEIVLVSYVLTDTGETITIPKEASTETVPLYIIERMIDGNSTGSSRKFVTHFLVELLNKGSSDYNANTASCATNLAKVRFELKFATEGIEYATMDQLSTSQSNVTRYGSTVDLSNMQ